MVLDKPYEMVSQIQRGHDPQIEITGVEEAIKKQNEVKYWKVNY